MTDDNLHLIHISECAARALSYVAKGREEFMLTALIQDAVIRNLQVLTESSQRISDSLQAQHPEINWPQMASFRNVLVHEYMKIDLNRVWKIIEQDLPILKNQVEAILKARGVLK